MAVWALADLHLSFGVPNKKMDIFGKQWENHAAKIKANWLAAVEESDLVLIPGDISWAMRSEEVLPDLQWVGDLPGTKVILRGNHDYWWTSYSKVQQLLPPSIHAIQNNNYHWQGVSLAGARLWDTDEYNFNEIIEFSGGAKDIKEMEPCEAFDREAAQKVFHRELQRLEMSLKGLDQNATLRIAMTHYPPIGVGLSPSQVSALLEKYKVNICVFGHLHSVKQGFPLFGEKNGIRYILTSCDYLNFTPVRIM